jgi:hypothetical protein
MHISPWLIRRSSQIVAVEAATHMFNFAMLQIVCGIRRDTGAPSGIAANSYPNQYREVVVFE